MKNIPSLERVAVLHKAVQDHAQAIQQAAGQGLADRLQAEDKGGYQDLDNIAPRNGGFLLGVDNFN